MSSNASPNSILVIDDDVRLCELLVEYLTRFDFKVQTAQEGSSGLALIQKSPPDLVVLDVMIPELDGFAVLKQIRQQGRLPVIMLTARGELSDKVVGLELGADDYLAKPFEPRELVARIQTVLRRAQSMQDKRELDYGELTIDLSSRTVVHHGRTVNLTTAEFEVLAVLAAQPGKVVSRDSLMEQLRGMDWDAYNRSIDITISRLRSKLGDDAKNPHYIKTIRGKGYTFAGSTS